MAKVNKQKIKEAVQLLKEATDFEKQEPEYDYGPIMSNVMWELLEPCSYADLMNTASVLAELSQQCTAEAVYRLCGRISELSEQADALEQHDTVDNVSEEVKQIADIFRTRMDKLEARMGKLEEESN